MDKQTAACSTYSTVSGAWLVLIIKDVKTRPAHQRHTNAGFKRGRGVAGVVGSVPGLEGLVVQRNYGVEAGPNAGIPFRSRTEPPILLVRHFGNTARSSASANITQLIHYEQWQW